MTDPCVRCAHSPGLNALRCTGGFNALQRENPATSNGWANPRKAEAEGYCPFRIEEDEPPEDELEDLDEDADDHDEAEEDEANGQN